MYYFAFGSNLKESRMTKDKHQIRVISKQVVTLHDFVFCANIVSSNYRDPNDPEKRYAVANIMPQEGSTVEGILYEIEDEDIKTLDAWERAYTRQEITVRNTSGEEITAYTYIGKKEREMDGLSFHPEYFQIIYEGATDPTMPLSEGHIQFLETMRPIEPMDPELQPLGRRL